MYIPTFTLKVDSPWYCYDYYKRTICVQKQHTKKLNKKYILRLRAHDTRLSSFTFDCRTSCTRHVSVLLLVLQYGFVHTTRVCPPSRFTVRLRAHDMCLSSFSFYSTTSCTRHVSVLLVLQYDLVHTTRVCSPSRFTVRLRAVWSSVILILYTSSFMSHLCFFPDCNFTVLYPVIDILHSFVLLITCKHELYLISHENREIRKFPPCRYYTDRYLRNVYTKCIVFSDVFRFSFLNKKYYAIELYLSRVYLYSGTCLISHTKGLGKRVGLYRMSEYSGFI